MDIQQLRTLMEVVHHGSFAGAARQLNVAPSMVSRAVAAIESDLGVRLLQRTTRRLALTDAGKTYVDQVSHALSALDSANDTARASAGEVRGTVRVTASVAYGQTVLVPLLKRLHQRHPQLQVELLLTDAVVDLVADRVDVAVRLGPPTDSSLVGLQLAPVRYHVCASPAYLAHHARPRTPSDLSQCDCLRFPLPGYRTQWKFRKPQGEPFAVDVRGWLVLSTALALHRAALDGLGPVLLGDWLVASDLAQGRLIDLFPEHEVTATDFDSAVWLLYVSRTHVPNPVRAMVDFIKAELAPVT